MELGERGLSPAHIDPDAGEQQSAPNINDVLQAIEAADPSFREQAVVGVAAPVAPGAMFGGSVQTGAVAGGAPSAPAHSHSNVYINIVEQPASKALRFRYECEGRSAGSIPGARSTAENKTFPTIEIVGVGHSCRAVVVVSCVTKDKPYKAHPHNLVGKDLCRDGVCTMQVNPDTMTASFTNLGIQCVKKRDIEEALRVRESIRVDPFKMGFSHKSQPSSIDLNAVRLCFQVFLEQDGKFKVALPPVVSEVIYDKKAMSELTICRMSHCAASVAGGQEVILLCEKVAKEDISVNLFELSEDGSKVMWSADGESVLVHKQVAIAFRTPRYSHIQLERSIHAFIQLKRPSDGATSDPRPFELTPVHSGRPSFYRKRNADLSLFALLSDAAKTDGNNNQQKVELASAETSDVSHSADSCSVNISETSAAIESVSNGNIGEDLRDSSTSHPSSVEREIVQETVEMDVVPTEKTLNDLLDQVAELDEIYSENRTRLENVSALDSDQADVDMEDFDDAGTYTSLQLAFKNPVPIAEPDISYEDVHVQTYRGPIIEFSPLKREEDVPPLPPKRIRKAPSVETVKVNHTSVESLLRPGKPIPLSRSRNDLSVSEPALPPEPPKKRSFLSRLFRRRNKSPPPSKAERNSEDGNGRRTKPVGRSVSSVSGQRPSKFKVAVSHTSLKDNASTTGLSYADSVTHISLHGDDNTPNPPSASASTRSLRPGPPLGDDTILVAETVLALSASDFKKLQEDLDLTEAENYALYMAVAPHATASEFDETSCYYSPVDGAKFQQS